MAGKTGASRSTTQASPNDADCADRTSADGTSASTSGEARQVSVIVMRPLPQQYLDVHWSTNDARAAVLFIHRYLYRRWTAIERRPRDLPPGPTVGGSKSATTRVTWACSSRRRG